MKAQEDKKDLVLGAIRKYQAEDREKLKVEKKILKESERLEKNNKFHL